MGLRQLLLLAILPTARNDGQAPPLATGQTVPEALSEKPPVAQNGRIGP